MQTTREVSAQAREYLKNVFMLTKQSKTKYERRDLAESEIQISMSSVKHHDSVKCSLNFV